MTRPFFSVVINTCDRRDQTGTLLATLEHQTYADFEVVVVVGPTRDDTHAMLAERYRGRVVVADCAEFNLSASRNVGLAHAAGDVVAFIDDDAVPSRAWLAQLAEAYADDVAGVGGRTHQVRPEGGELQFVGGWISTLADQHDIAWDAQPPAHSATPRRLWYPRFHGCNMSYRREALLAIGGCDERFAYLFEDSDLGVRLGRVGRRLRHSLDAVVYHAAATGRNRGRRGRFDLNWYDWLRAQIYFTLKHGRPTAGLRRSLVAAARHVSRLDAVVREVRGFGEIDAEQYAAARRQLARARRDGLVQGLLLGPRTPAALAPLRTSPSRFQTATSRFVPAVPATGVAPHVRLSPLDSPPLSICILSVDYPPRSTQGVARHSHMMAQGLAELGHEVHVVTAGKGPRITHYDGAYVHELPATVPDRYGAYREAGLPNLASWLAHSHAAHDAVRALAQNDTIEIVDSPLWNLDGLVTAVSGELPLAVRICTAMKQIAEFNRDRSEDSRILGELEAELICRADVVVPNSQASVESVREVYGIDLARRPHAVVPHGIVPVDEAAVARAAAEAAAHAPEIRILFVGRLEARKGILDLFAAIPGVLASDPRVRFVLAGADNSRHDGFAARHGVDYPAYFRATYPQAASRVEFTGFVDEARLAGLYRACDLFVAPSLYESFGLIYLEAMNFAKPVVACAAGGPKEIVVEGETGRLVAPSDPAALAAALTSLAGDAALRRAMGRAGRARLLDRFTHVAMARGFVDLYRAAIERHPRRKEARA